MVPTSYVEGGNLPLQALAEALLAVNLVEDPLLSVQDQCVDPPQASKGLCRWLPSLQPPTRRHPLADEVVPLYPDQLAVFKNRTQAQSHCRGPRPINLTLLQVCRDEDLSGAPAGEFHLLASVRMLSQDSHQLQSKDSRAAFNLLQQLPRFLRLPGQQRQS
jgi:hypothetical protein